VLQPGCVVVVPAGRVHACNPLPGQGWNYQMLHLDAHWVHAVRNEMPAPTGNEVGMDAVRVCDDPVRYRQFCDLNALLFSSAAMEAKDAALVAFIGDLDPAQGDALEDTIDQAALQRRLAPVTTQLRQDLAHTPPLDDLARRVGMSRYQLIRAFRRATGLTPHAWQMDQRIQRARLQLRDGDALAAIAHGLGFSDQSHFQRMFKAHTAATPGQYRR
jgi:AraC-like DNA-binding protein